MLRVLDLFSGIGGFSLGLERTGGFKTIGFCEKDKFCQQVLAKHWQGVPIIEDIHDVTTDTLYQQGIRNIDVITAGFPCQPFSAAGKQRGTEDERFLWTELFRVIEQVRPSYIILENVPRLLSIENGIIFGGILYDLRQIGYDAEWQVISAAAIGAWHKRERLWIVAYPSSQRRRQGFDYWKSRHFQINVKRHSQKIQPIRQRWVNRFGSLRSIFPNTNSDGCPPQNTGQRNPIHNGNRNHKTQKQGWEQLESGLGGNSSTLPNANIEGLEGSKRKVFEARYSRRLANSGWREQASWKTEPGVGRVAHGVPNRSHRIKSLGNAVVPQIPQFIGECILQREAV